MIQLQITIRTDAEKLAYGLHAVKQSPTEAELQIASLVDHAAKCAVQNCALEKDGSVRFDLEAFLADARRQLVW